MTEEALAAPAPAPAPAPAEAAEAVVPAKAAAVETKTEEEEHAGAAPKTADDAVKAPAPAMTTTTEAPVKTEEEAAGGDEGGDAKKDPPPADSVISARLREMLEVTDLETTSGENKEFRMDQKSSREREGRTTTSRFCWLALPSLSLCLCCFVPPSSPAS